MLSAERFDEVDKLFDQVLDIPSAERERWLRDACRGDDELRAEVEKLLALAVTDQGPLHASGGMDGPVWEDVARELGVAEDELLAGQKLGDYEVVGLLGKGGMGSVYRAKDQTLGREVAIKALSGSFAVDASSWRRFQREAKLLASLNHPNIAAIYELLALEGRLYLVLELVEGDTLADRLAFGALTIRETVHVATGLVDAIEEAHRKDIVHRDLKPSNVKLSHDGRVKVLDFGLAKPIQESESSDQGADRSLTTAAGMVLGTPAYMSPEQARGETVDSRSDIWAFGCLLYEMLTGERPFRGQNVSETIASVLRDGIDWDRLPRATPPQLVRLLRRSLQKNPRERLQHIGNARIELAELGSGAVSASSESTSSRKSWEPFKQASFRPALVVAGLIAVLALVAYFVPSGQREPPVLSNPHQVTASVGSERAPSLSPDNRFLAYASPLDGRWDVWVTEASGGPGINRTREHDGMDMAPSWSPDGSGIAFRSDRDGGGIFLMTPMTGASRKLVSRWDAVQVQTVPQWSADGSELAFTSLRDEGESVHDLSILRVATGEVRVVELPGRWDCRCAISWSRDGRFLAYVDSQEPTSQISQLWIHDFSHGESVRVTDGSTRDWSPSWGADSRELYFLSNRGGSRDLWVQSVTRNGEPAGEPRPVTVGVGMESVSFSWDHTKLSYAKGRRSGNLFRIPILEDRLATWNDAEQLTYDEAFLEFVDVSPDGSRVVFSSDRDGNPDLWSLDLESRQMKPLTDDPTPDWLPSFSPDGRVIAFYAYRSGNRDLWVMPSTGGPARQITHDEASDLSPFWSPDGRALLFYSNRGATVDIFRISIDSGEVEPLVATPALERFGKWSPNGAWIVYVATADGVATLWKMQADPQTSAEPEELLVGLPFYPVWARDSQSVFVTPVAGAGHDIWRVSLEGELSQVTGLSGRPGELGQAALATDGRFLYFTWEQDLSDIWTMNVK